MEEKESGITYLASYDLLHATTMITYWMLF
jgi:hypothetical protein